MGNFERQADRAMDRRFFLACALWFTVLSLLAFLPPTIGRMLHPEGFPYSHPSVALHGITFSAWVLFYLSQTWLIGHGKVALHRRLGMFGAGLLVLVFYSGMAMIMTKWQSGAASQAQTAFNFMSFVTGFGLGVAAIAMRRTAYFHKRLMLGATVVLTSASASRTMGLLGFDPGFYPSQAFVGLPLLALLVYDLWQHRRPWAALVPITAFLLVSTLYIHRPLLVNPAGEAFMENLAAVFMPWGATWRM